MTRKTWPEPPNHTTVHVIFPSHTDCAKRHDGGLAFPDEPNQHWFTDSGYAQTWTQLTAGAVVVQIVHLEELKANE